MDFQTLVTQWIAAQIQLYQGYIAKQRADYQKKNWRWSEDAARDFNNRISELQTLRINLLNELTRGRSHGNGLFTLANIVFNEAGAYNQNAKLAVAYAWLNRTGTIREPVGQEVSNYRPLLDRWNSLDEGQRLIFVRNFIPSLSAARQRLEDRMPVNHDPTRGATHWVSPLGLPEFRNQLDTYSRTVGNARNRAFPTWARSTNDPEVAKMQKRGQMGSNFAELTVAGVESTHFLFYIGVR